MGAKTPLLRCLWQGRFHTAVFLPQTLVFAVIKSSKAEPFPFPKRGDVDTYPSRPTASARSPSQEASGRDRSASSGVRRDRFGTGFLKAAQRFNAGWSSPVARQAHNLKVIGSNPIPATNYNAKPRPSRPGFSFWGNPSSRQRVMPTDVGGNVVLRCDFRRSGGTGIYSW